MTGQKRELKASRAAAMADNKDDFQRADHELLPALFSKKEWSAIARRLNLSQRQAQIVDLVLRGQRDKEIMARLGLQKTTIRTHMADIFVKAKAGSRMELAYRVFMVFRRGDSNL
jgi:DNA-binding NarL/FixJ family response regulator